MSLILDGSNGITFPNSSTQAVGFYGFKNRIINGGMVIDQRDAGASVTASTTGSYVYTLDRWRYYATAASKYTVQQNAGSVTPPVGFTNYIGITSSSAYSVGSSDTFFLSQVIEGFNIADLGWGTANAKTVTLSFQVYSSLTGTFGGSLRNLDAPNRSYPFSYTVSSANTWTTISVTIAGDITGTWNTTNGQGIQVQLNLGSGSTLSGTAGSWQAGNLIAPTGATSVVGTNGATFYITGVQLEAGSTATSFDYRPYGTELNLCQRYYEVMYEPFGAGRVNATPACRYFARYSVIKRATPTIGYSGSFSTSDMYTVDTQQSSASGLNTVSGTTTSGTIFGFNVSTLANQTPFTNSAMCFNLNNGASLTASAEL